MAQVVISVEQLSKSYQLGEIGTGRFYGDLARWWARQRGKPDPYLKIGQEHTANRQGETIWALKDVSFKVRNGEAVGIIGRNGAGKSTLLKILSQVAGPTSGRVKIKGRLASLLEVGTGFHPELTGRENIYLNGAIMGMSRAEVRRKLDEIVDFSGVETYIDTPVKRYSSGMYVRLAFAVAAHLEPDILVVDEVLAVGDAEFQRKCLGKMGEVAQGGRTVLFVSHNLGAIENLCQRGIILNGGEIVNQGPVTEMVNYYSSEVLEQAIQRLPLADRSENRRGNGNIRLVEFCVRNRQGERLASIRSGMDVIFEFGYETRSQACFDDVDIGFSVATYTGQMLFVFYSSYKGQTFQQIAGSGVVQCLVRSFPLTPGRYLLGARITVSGEEADWPVDGLGFVDVEAGDFFGTGHKGYEGHAPFYVNGDWTIKSG